MIERAKVEIADHAPHVLVVDDDRRLRQLLARFLGEHGYRVTTAASAAEARAKGEALVFDAIVLDVMMPGETGFDYARRLRTQSQIPILMLTARANSEDRVTGLEIGADDYLPKPFESRELLARVRAILRRKLSPAQRDVLRFGRLEVDRGARRARLDGRDCMLTSHQFALLDALAGHAGRVMSRDALMDLLKGESAEAFDRSVDVHISRIRSAVEDDPKKPRRIITVRGAGYVFAREQD
jgi:two-component system, OmpR family, phosphate regulon response regulator OmpR